MKERVPKKFSGDVRSWKPRPHEVQDWEEVTDSTEVAQEEYEHFIRALNEYGAPLTPDSRVLEVGSGSGKLLSVLQSEGINAVGVDIRPRSEEVLPVVRARIERLPFPDDTFDAVFSEKVFDTTVYKQRHDLMLKEIARVLKPDGLYVARYEALSVFPEGLKLVSGKKNPWIEGVYKKNQA